MNKKKLLIVIGVLLILLGIIILSISITNDKEEFKLDREKVIRNLEEEGYKEVEDSVYAIYSEDSNGTVAYIFDFNESKFQLYYKNKEFNSISEYNYLYNKSSYTFIRGEDRGTINYDHNTKKIDCDSNILNWCDENKKDFNDKYSIYDEFLKITK